MIWHIFKKNICLLWPLVAVVAAMQFLGAALWLTLGHFREPLALFRIWQFLPLAIWLGMAVLIATAVHQDRVPGDRQDWLVRPIRRRDVLLAKLLFIIIAVHGPMLLADLVHGLATGFSFGSSLSASVAHGVSLLLDFDLPMLAVAAVTTSLVEFIGGMMAIGLVATVILITVPEFFFGGGNPPVAASGMGWMMSAVMSAVALAAVALVVPLQYFRRSTMRARGIVLGAALLAPLSMFIPWTPAFSVQQWLSADPAAAKTIAVAYDPALGRQVIEPGGQNRANSIWLPLTVSGLAPESIVISDQANIRIIGPGGAVLYQGRTTGDPQTTGALDFGPFHIEDFPVRTTTGTEARIHQLITLPGKVYERMRSEPVRIELDYSLTLYRIEANDTMTPLKGDKRIANLGWCKTRIDDSGDRVDVGCIQTGGDNPMCITTVLENTVTGQRNPPNNACRPDYSPTTTHFDPNSMSNFGSRLSFRDPQGLAKYPVDSSQLGNAQVSLKAYKPVAHFTRQLVIPEIRLGDWEAQTLEAATGSIPQPR